MGQGSHADYGGVDAKWGSITRDGDGNITNATVSCDRLCRMDGANQGRVTSHDIALAAMRSSVHHNQNLSLHALAYTGLAFTGSYYTLSVGGSYLAASPTVKALMFELMSQVAMDARAIQLMMKMDNVPSHMHSLLRGGSKWGNVTKGKLPPKPRLKIGKSGKPHMPIYH